MIASRCALSERSVETISYALVKLATVSTLRDVCNAYRISLGSVYTLDAPKMIPQRPVAPAAVFDPLCELFV
jgi:hypothetical protein